MRGVSLSFLHRRKTEITPEERKNGRRKNPRVLRCKYNINRRGSWGRSKRVKMKRIIKKRHKTLLVQQWIKGGIMWTAKSREGLAGWGYGKMEYGIVKKSGDNIGSQLAVENIGRHSRQGWRLLVSGLVPT